MNEYDTRLWKEKLMKMPTLRYYNKGKDKIGYDFCYRNNSNSKFLARARINCLNLEEAKGRGNKKYNKTCKLCNQEEEDLVHFIINCKTLEAGRNYSLLKESIIDPEERMIDLLFKNKEHQKVGKMIKKLWYMRRNLIEQKKDENNNKRKIRPRNKRRKSEEEKENPKYTTCR